MEDKKFNLKTLEKKLDELVERGFQNPLISQSYLSEFYWWFNHDYGDGRIGSTINLLEEIATDYYENNPLKEKGGVDKKAEGNPHYEAVKLMYEIGKAAKKLAEALGK